MPAAQFLQQGCGALAEISFDVPAGRDETLNDGDGGALTQCGVIREKTVRRALASSGATR